MLKNVHKKHVDTARTILTAVRRIGGVAPDTLKSPENTRYLFRVRLAAVYLLREHTELTYDQVGALVGRDRSSCFRMKKKADDLITGDPKFWELLESIKTDFWREQ